MVTKTCLPKVCSCEGVVEGGGAEEGLGGRNEDCGEVGVKTG